ncbi:uncharacterized protein LOC130504566 [Raphanus sativus]|uniref:Uncharacterized protein LOC130504566 n=1 Tax=Raphanus sativus TaxID=3726 RepID=A0A9W3CUJ6_RAPSA|nr:uncharacterized protein LOC130504566 [Raphanus sativus]
METLFQSYYVPEEEKLSYATKTLTGPALAWWEEEEYDSWYCGDPAHTWESFKFEILEDFVKKGPEFEFPMILTHAGWHHTSTISSKPDSKQANQHHSPQKIEPAVKKKTVKKQEGSQLSSLQLIKVPETFPSSKGTLQPGKNKAEVVLERREPQTEDQAMAQGLEKPPASSNQRTEVTDHMDDPHKEITRCLNAKVKQEVTTSNFLNPDDPPGPAPSTRKPDHSRGVVLSFLLKGEPPDVIQFRGRNFFKGEGMMRPSNQWSNQSSTKLPKPTTLEPPAIEVQ